MNKMPVSDRSFSALALATSSTRLGSGACITSPITAMQKAAAEEEWTRATLSAVQARHDTT
jgi:hypothetical protein